MLAELGFYNGGAWGTSINNVPIFTKLHQKLPRDLCVTCEKFYSITSIGIEIQTNLEASNDNSQMLIVI